MVPKRPIFMDNHSTTAVDPRVAQAMTPYYSESFGNAASRNHAFGWEAEAAVDSGRAHIAALIGGRADNIVFTSGATESNNLAIKGAMSAHRDRGNHIVTVSTEHKSVVDTCARLARDGFEVTWLEPGGDGLVTPDQVAAAVTERTVLVSIMHVNNEIGVVQPIADIGAAIRVANPSVLFHCDAAQSAAVLPVDVAQLNVDLLSLSAHKMYGPKGVGALWVRGQPEVRLDPLIDGGGHERGLRAGTLPVPLIVGFGRAAELVRLERADDAERVSALRDRLRDALQRGVDRIHINGSAKRRVPGNLNVSFGGVDGESLLMALSEHVAVSSGAACSSAAAEPSYVLRALGVSDELSRASIRFGLGRFNSEPEVDSVAAHVIETVRRLRDAATA